jgi:hypothetical protein
MSTSETNTSLPSPPQVERQSTTCDGCDECRPRTLSLSLPPPSPATRCIAAPEGFASPLAYIGLLSPRSISDTSVSLDDQIKICEEFEARVIRYLKRLSKHYETLQTLITEKKDLTHDEMAAYDMWWDEVDMKLDSTEKLIRTLKK